MGPPIPKIAKEPKKKGSTLDSEEEDKSPKEEEDTAPAEAAATLQPIVEMSEEFSRVASSQKLDGTPRTISALGSTSESAEHDKEGQATLKTASDTASDIAKLDTTKEARLEAEKLEEKRNETEAVGESQS